MTFDQLKEKAHSLPQVPGVYIMRDWADHVIYVGKAKKLRNRVSQYFVDTVSHSPKTRLMVSNIDHFDVIVARSEFESLVLECSLIKQHRPKYNILLKDDKGYPYVRLDMNEPYPRMRVVNRISDDKAEYFGPFGSKGKTEQLIKIILQTLKLPACNRTFPKDMGTGRPCLNYHMGHCSGWCRNKESADAYKETMWQARLLLSGEYKLVAKTIRNQMLDAADNMEFELAASLRNRLDAIEALGKKQTVVAEKIVDFDVIGYAETETKACFAVLHYSNGNLVDKEYEVFSTPDDNVAAVSSLLKQYYLSRGTAPKLILIPFTIEDEFLFAQLLEQEFGKKIKIRVPQRGDYAKLLDLAVNNAREEAVRLSDKEEQRNKVLYTLKNLLCIDSVNRIESFDISNISGTDNVAGMVVIENGKPKKSDYKRFKIDNLGQQDDYASMACAVRRRFTHYLNSDDKFEDKPDLLLIDGGAGHVAVVRTVLQELGLDLNVFGMVKDDKHRTRALVTPDGEEIAIDTKPAVFAFIGTIQEETHRFAISYHKKLRSTRLRYSQLDKIPGIGKKRKEVLLKQFKSISGISNASLEELERVLPRDVAGAVYAFFHREKEDQ